MFEVSTKVPPASVNRSRIAVAVCSSTVVPKVMAPRHSALAFGPSTPTLRYSISHPSQGVVGNGGARRDRVTGIITPVMPDSASVQTSRETVRFVQDGASGRRLP